MKPQVHFCYTRVMIEVNGRIRHKRLVEDYVLNLCRSLSLDRRKSWSIEVSFVGSLEGGCMGLCTDDPDNEILVEIARSDPSGSCINFYVAMQTLAHEMVHAKQFIKGEYPSEREAKALEFELFAKCFPWRELP